MVEFGDARLPPRFWNKVDRNGPLWNGTHCWVWTAAKKQLDYGQFKVDRKTILAHRFSYETLVCPIPKGKELDHLCRNPPCVNPSHLEPVTHQINNQRGETGKLSGMLQKSKTHCPKGHPYNKENTYVNKVGKRFCRTCRRESVRKCRQK